VLRLLVAERSDREIAMTLSVSRKTASNHVAAILRKLNVQTRVGAVRRAIAERLVDVASTPSRTPVK
jgi:two-component system vancomycin resistance associated response regulator VraR